MAAEIDAFGIDVVHGLQVGKGRQYVVNFPQEGASNQPRGVRTAYHVFKSASPNYSGVHCSVDGLEETIAAHELHVQSKMLPHAVEMSNPENNRGVLKAMRHVNLDIPKGSIVGVVGESGCGKSTLISSIFKVLASR